MRQSEPSRRQGATRHEPLNFAASIGPRFAARALVALLTAAGALSGSVMAQDVAATDSTAEGEAVSSETLVARFDLPRDALDEVASSVELVAALREHLTIDVAMPLDEPLLINLHGLAGRREGGQGPVYHFGLSPLGVGYEGETPLEGFPYALAVRESHGADFPPDGDEWAEFDADDWHEEEAWNRLVDALDVGLPQSTTEFGRPGEGGHVGLAVTDVHLREFTLDGPADSAWADFGGCCDDLDDRAVFVLRPEPAFQSMTTEGDTTARDLEHRLNVLAISLDPIPETSGSAASDDAMEDTEALEATAMLQWACYEPELAGSDVSSTAEVSLDDQPRTGEAIVAVDGDLEGVIKVAGGDGEEDFCLILMGRGGPSEPGTYPIRKLTRDRGESEPDPADPWIAASLGFGADRATLFVAESGFVEITSMESSVLGHFEIVGWSGDGGNRGEEQTITGSFEATPAAR